MKCSKDGMQFHWEPLSCQPGFFFSSISEPLSLSFLFPLPKQSRREFGNGAFWKIYTHPCTHTYLFLFLKIKRDFQTRPFPALFMEGHHTSSPAPFCVLQYPWGQKGTGKVKLLLGTKQCQFPGLQRPLCSRYAYGITVYTNYPCKWAVIISMHNYPSCTCKPSICIEELSCVLALFVWVLTHCLCLCDFHWSPTLMPGLAVEQCHVSPACPHLLRSLHSTGTGRRVRCWVRAAPANTQSCKQSWLRWSRYGRYPRAHQIPLWFSLQGLEQWPNLHPPSPAPLQGALQLLSALSHTTFHNKYLYFPETIPLSSSLHFLRLDMQC